jgi:hypothetical protein
MIVRRLFLGLFGLSLSLIIFAAGAGADPLAAQDTPDETGDATAAVTVTATVRGVAVNRTGGGAAPAGLPITLHSIDRVAGRVATIEATTGPDGGFRFENVAILDDGSYALVMDFDGMRYSSMLQPEELSNSRSEPVALTVYETTRDVSVVQVQRQAMIIADVNQGDRQITALEFLSITNAGDRTLLPELTNITNPNEISFLRFSLPPEATDLDVQSNLSGGDIITIGTGFAITSPVIPGDYRINYSYKFPYENDAVTFQQRLIQGALVYQVLAPKRLEGIQVAPLEAMPDIDVNGMVYRVWESRDLPPRQGVTLELSQLPQPSLLSRMERAVTDGGLWQTAIPIVLGIALAAVLIYAWFRGPRVATVPEGPVTYTGAQFRRQALIQSIAALDNRFEQSRLPEAEYRSHRERLLDQIRLTGDPANSGNPGNPGNPSDPIDSSNPVNPAGDERSPAT